MVALPGTGKASTTLEEQQPTSRSFFSRFALPIRSRNTRNVVDFHIRPSEPHRKYTAGDNVRGAVILTVVKPIRLTHLTVALRGFVHVYKSPNAANESVSPCGIDSDGLSQFKFLGNGYASLFQDEQVLCAEGRLESGKYEFNFDLLFPETALPSSIEFERGAIGYNIIATLTRPTSINATSSCERKVELVEQVDVGFLPSPRPRTIYLQPISKKSKKKKQVAYTNSEKANSIVADTAESISDRGSARAVENPTDGFTPPSEETALDAHQSPRSPVHSDLRSEISGDSTMSGSTGLSSRDRVDSSQSQSQVGSFGTIHPGGGLRPEEKTITTTIELMKSGCLPGDTISVKVDVQHTKRIKSLHGVIVTLYRQGRVDSAPPAALFKNISKEEVRRLEKEEYYPRSKTGLGGLSLSSAGTCSMFRKDLSQAFSPLIIDPVTLTASVTTSVRVPENAFPSIRGVPGEMISFKYRLEVIVDLGGKLANTIQVQQNPRVSTSGSVLAPGRELTAGVASFDGSLVNTDPLKRGKGVIFDSFEVVVGTTDSTRRGRGVRPTPSVHTSYVQDGTVSPEHGPWPGQWEDEGYSNEEAYPQGYMPYPAEPAAHYPYWNGGSHDHVQHPAPQYIPPPELPDESGLSEKDRVRRAEQRLLPSQPEVSSPTPGPSAPAVDVDGAGPSTPAGPSAPPPAPSTDEAPSAPTLEDLAAGSSMPNANAEDDKQELERRRLLAEASAPPEFPPGDFDAGVGSSAGPSAPPLAPEGDGPSAPDLTEEEYGSRFSYDEVAGSSNQAPSAPH
ncbi:pH-response regulator protein palF/RIM8, partial [Cytospora mali]